MLSQTFVASLSSLASFASRKNGEAQRVCSQEAFWAEMSSRHPSVQNQAQRQQAPISEQHRMTLIPSEQVWLPVLFSSAWPVSFVFWLLIWPTIHHPLAEVLHLVQISRFPDAHRHARSASGRTRYRDGALSDAAESCGPLGGDLGSGHPQDGVLGNEETVFSHVCQPCNDCESHVCGNLRAQPLNQWTQTPEMRPQSRFCSNERVSCVCVGGQEQLAGSSHDFREGLAHGKDVHTSDHSSAPLAQPNDGRTYGQLSHSGFYDEAALSESVSTLPPRICGVEPLRDVGGALSSLRLCARGCIYRGGPHSIPHAHLCSNRRDGRHTSCHGDQIFRLRPHTPPNLSSLSQWRIRYRGARLS